MVHRWHLLDLRVEHVTHRLTQLCRQWPHDISNSLWRYELRAEKASKSFFGPMKVDVPGPMELSLPLRLRPVPAAPRARQAAPATARATATALALCGLRAVLPRRPRVTRFNPAMAASMVRKPPPKVTWRKKLFGLYGCTQRRSEHTLIKG